MSCTNCYNGCVETTSDKCVRYTGSDNAELLISNGDSLYVVEQILIERVASFLDGTGITIDIPLEDYCAVVTTFLPVGVVPNAYQLFKALVQGLCYVHGQVGGLSDAIIALNANYTIGCLTGVTSSSDTHAIVQAVINKVCATDTDLEALALDVDTNYVKLANLNTLIASYQASLPGLAAKNMTTGQRDAMVSPARGLIIFNTTTSKLNVFTGSAWQVITSV
jgi:hypothetical protein